MKESFLAWLETLGIQQSDKVYLLIAIGVIILISLIVHLVLHQVVLRFLERSANASEHVWRRALFGRQLFTRLALTLQGIILAVQAKIWLDGDSAFLPVIQTVTHLWILFYSLLSLFSLLDTSEDIAKTTKAGRELPLRGIFQSIKLIASILVIIFAIALLIGKSPVILFSGLGAMTAVGMLVFKDPILGFVAGIQLSANRMLSVGDWLEMPKYGADGDVIDINLTTVKVQNWDKTITTIPAYALISDSFKNWRGMSEAGGRRIKRSINIDTTSVKFLSDEDIARLRKAKLLSSYIEEKLTDITAYNKEYAGDSDSPVNMRKLTNLGTFRAYLAAYLKAHKNIHKDMTQMVRQLQPGESGVPLEIYAFTNDVAWVNYEGIQADIFDHIFAVAPEFGLRIYQTPTGYDIQKIGAAIKIPAVPSASDTGSVPDPASKASVE